MAKGWRKPLSQRTTTGRSYSGVHRSSSAIASREAARAGTVSLQVEGYEDLAAAIARVSRGMEDLRPAWEMFYKPAFADYVDEWWESEGRGATGGKWRNPTRKYLKWKLRHGGGSELMVLRGNAGDIKQRLKDEIFRPEPRSMEIGASTPGYSNTPRGRMIIYAYAPQMKRNMTEAVEDHGRWVAEKWGRA